MICANSATNCALATLQLPSFNALIPVRRLHASSRLQDFESSFRFLILLFPFSITTKITSRYLDQCHTPTHADIHTHAHKCANTISYSHLPQRKSERRLLLISAFRKELNPDISPAGILKYVFHGLGLKGADTPRGFRQLQYQDERSCANAWEDVLITFTCVVLSVCLIMGHTCMHVLFYTKLLRSHRGSCDVLV